jgi:hypothetical protein
LWTIKAISGRVPARGKDQKGTLTLAWCSAASQDSLAEKLYEKKIT